MSSPASTNQDLGFFARLWMAWVCFFQILFNAPFARSVLPAYQARLNLPPGTTPAAVAKPAAEKPVPSVKPVAAPKGGPEAALFLLGIFQREGRLIDFLQENVTSFSDAEVGAAARVVHQGCQKVLSQYLPVSPVRAEAEGDRLTVPAGFDAGRIRLTGNVAGQPPFTGTLRHRGWEVKEVKLPETPSLDVRVIAPAEVELG